MRRTERLFAIAEALRARRTGITAEALAARFEVSVRQMYRDLTSLRDASLPVAAERGRGGGYALERGYALPPVSFTAREAAVLVAAGRFLLEMRMMPFSATLERALDKARGALSASAQRELIAHLDAIQYLGVPARPIARAVRRAVEEAWFEQRPLRVVYVSRTGERSERRVRVRKVVLDRSEARLFCDDLERGEPRELVMDRIESARLEPARAGAGRAR